MTAAEIMGMIENEYYPMAAVKEAVKTLVAERGEFWRGRM